MVQVKYGECKIEDWNAYIVPPIIEPASIPPGAPAISSSTHPNENTWYCNKNVTFTWTTPPDESGIACYSYALDHSSTTTPDETCDTTGNSKAYTNLTTGIWYFHVRAKDNDNNWGPADHYRVMIENCSDYDGWYCTGDVKEYRDYYCSEGNCSYTVTEFENCSLNDGGVNTSTTRWIEDPENPCREIEQQEQDYFDYFCTDGNCSFTITGTQWVDTGTTRNKSDGTDCGFDPYGDWEYYCSGESVWKHRLFHDFYCEAGSCTDHTSWADAQLVENCSNFDGWYCNGDVREYRDYYCSESNCSYTVTEFENCSLNSGWVETGNLSWVGDPENPCRVKEQREEEYHDYFCADGNCSFTINGTRWIDTGNNSTKPDSTICNYSSWQLDPENLCQERREILKCLSGTCTPSGEFEYQNKPDGTLCGCTENNTLKRCSNGTCSDTGICNSTLCDADAACAGKQAGEECGVDSRCTSNCNCVETVIFSTGSPDHPYPSISGTHNGTITPSQNITVSTLYTVPCPGTGGHTEYAAFYYTNETLIAEAHWHGYQGDWRNISFNKTFTLIEGETYHYTIRTGSYPQIHHTPALPTVNGWINCTVFIAVDGVRYTDWIPAIKLA